MHATLYLGPPLCMALLATKSCEVPRSQVSPAVLGIRAADVDASDCSALAGEVDAHSDIEGTGLRDQPVKNCCARVCK